MEQEREQMEQERELNREKQATMEEETAAASQEIEVATEISLEQLQRFFQTHDGAKLVESSSPSDEELNEFLSSMSAGEIEEMLVEEHGEGLQAVEAATAIETTGETAPRPKQQQKQQGRQLPELTPRQNAIIRRRWQLPQNTMAVEQSVKDVLQDDQWHKTIATTTSSSTSTTASTTTSTTSSTSTASTTSSTSITLITVENVIAFTTRAVALAAFAMFSGLGSIIIYYFYYSEAGNDITAAEAWYPTANIALLFMLGSSVSSPRKLPISVLALCSVAWQYFVELATAIICYLAIALCCSILLIPPDTRVYSHGTRRKLRYINTSRVFCVGNSIHQPLWMC
jgi:hypothetical protein